MYTSKYIIIGAGLSGLTSGYYLNKANEKDFLILEARDRIGGRILTEDNIDMGGTWFQTHHEHVVHLLEELKLKKFYQYNKGKNVLIYSTMVPAHYFEKDPDIKEAFRIEGGSTMLINGLAKNIEKHIKTSTTVNKISEDNTKDGVIIHTNNGIYKAEKLIMALPPSLAYKISYHPPLPKSLRKSMKKTHTWMSNSIKIGLEFESPFWRKKELSGTVLGQVGAVTELYDHCNVENTTYTLMGFANEALRFYSKAERKEKILTHLQKYLGDEILNYTNYKEKDWSKDKLTTAKNFTSIYMSPKYGNPVFDDLYFNGKIIFSGAETAKIHGGYMDGAIATGITAAKKIIKGL